MELVELVSAFIFLTNTVSYDSIVCKISGFFLTTSAMCMIYALPLLTWNRYVKLYKSDARYKYTFNGKKIFFYFSVAIFISCVLVGFLGFAGLLGGPTNGLCALNITRTKLIWILITSTR